MRLISTRSGKGKHYCAGKSLLTVEELSSIKLIVLGKVMLPPGQDGPTIEQEIEAGGKLGEV